MRKLTLLFVIGFVVALACTAFAPEKSEAEKIKKTLICHISFDKNLVPDTGPAEYNTVGDIELVDGKVGKGVLVNQKDKQLGYAPGALMGGNICTIGAWVKNVGYSMNDGQKHVIFESPTYRIYTDPKKNALVLESVVPKLEERKVIHYFAEYKDFKWGPDEWHYVAFSYNTGKAEMKLFFDCKEVASYRAKDKKFFLGRPRYAAPQMLFNLGAPKPKTSNDTIIDELKSFSATLTEEQLKVVAGLK